MIQLQYYCKAKLTFLTGDPISQQASASIQYSPLRPRERTNSKRLSFTETEPAGAMYKVAPNSDMSERNDSASSVASFAEAQEDAEKSSCKSSLQCKICSRSFRSFKTLNQHLRLHMSQSYKCNTCGKIFTLKKSYLRHLKSHKTQKTDKLFECGLCDKSFVDLGSWKRHRMCHTDVRKYSCNLCGKAFYEKYSLRVHQTSHFFSSSVKTDKNTDVSSTFTCHVCGKQLKSRTAMKNHILTHSAKKFTCEFCAKRFSQKYSYIRHRRIHTGEKPYKCGECEKSFTDGSAWSKHIKTHTGIKPYSCGVCSKSFYDKTLCKTHMKTHKGKRAYKPADEDSKRNFKILSEGIHPSVSNESYKGPSDELSFDIAHTDNLFNDDLNLHLNISDKDSEDSQLLDTGFGADLLPPEDSQNKGPDKTGTSIMETLGLDEQFQSEFVERNMPSKPIESDNELISSAFAEDSDILTEEADADVEDAIGTDPIFPASKQTTSLQQSEKQNDAWQKKSASRKSVRGKVFPESPAKCKICHKKFKQESLLKQHLQFHCMSKLYKCRYCGKQLSTKHSLIRHERIHVGDRPYQCYICQKTFADNYGCIRHVNTHFNKESKTSKPARDSRKSNDSTFSYAGNPNQNQKYENSGFVSRSPKGFSPQKDGMKSETIQFTNTVSTEKVYCPKPDASFDLPGTRKEHASKSVPDITSEIPQRSLANSVTVESKHTGKTHLYKCFKCANLFSSEKQCVDHITQICSKQHLLASELVVSQTSNSQNACQVLDNESGSLVDPLPQTSKNLFQCSLCLLMFEDQSTCERHIASKCEKVHRDTECAVQSMLEQPLPEDLTKSEYEDLPRLPFPEVSADSEYLEIGDTQVILIPDNPVTSTVISSPSTNQPLEAGNPQNSVLASQASPTISFIPFTQIANPGTGGVKLSTGLQSTVQLPSDSQFTALLQKPVVNVGSSKFIIANQGINLVGQKSADVKQPGKPKKTGDKKPDDIVERTCNICNKVFTTKHILKQHTLIHMERKFGCKYCMKKFHNKYGRDRHERIHTGERPFSCPYCKKAFGDNSSYRKHTRNCSDQKSNLQ